MEKKRSGSPRRSITHTAFSMRISVSVFSPSARGTSPGPSPCSNAALISAGFITSCSGSPRPPRPWAVRMPCAGRVAEALPLLEQAEQRDAAMGTMGGQSLRVGYVSEAYLLAGRMQEAVQLAGRALDLARAHKERGHEAWALRLLGEIAAHQAPPEIEPAAHHYRQALALAEELGMRPLRPTATSVWARCMPGPASGSRPVLSCPRPSQMYRAMEMTFWLPQAEVALAQVEER